MFNQLHDLIQQVTNGEVDRDSVQQAAEQHVQSMDHTELEQGMQSAANTANENGQNDVAQQIVTIISQYRSNPQALKEQAIQFITNNPQILQHFEPEFAKGILARL